MKILNLEAHAMFWVARLGKLRVVEWSFTTVGGRSGYETEPEWRPKVGSFPEPFGTRTVDRFGELFWDPNVG